jgi:hypothetical protein
MAISNDGLQIPVTVVSIQLWIVLEIGINFSVSLIFERNVSPRAVYKKVKYSLSLMDLESI